MTRASFRLFRTLLIGSLIVALAAGGHLAGGGRLPEPAIVTALCAVAMVPVAVLTRFRLSFPVLAGLLGAGQLWLHWSFGALSAAAPVTMPARMAINHPGHAAAGELVPDQPHLALVRLIVHALLEPGKHLPAMDRLARQEERDVIGPGLAGHHLEVRRRILDIFHLADAWLGGAARHKGEQEQ